MGRTKQRPPEPHKTLADISRVGDEKWKKCVASELKKDLGEVPKLEEVDPAFYRDLAHVVATGLLMSNVNRDLPFWTDPRPWRRKLETALSKVDKLMARPPATVMIETGRREAETRDSGLVGNPYVHLDAVREWLAWVAQWTEEVEDWPQPEPLDHGRPPGIPQRIALDVRRILEKYGIESPRGETGVFGRILEAVLNRLPRLGTPDIDWHTESLASKERRKTRKRRVRGNSPGS
jgi:hypothetical protein